MSVLVVDMILHMHMHVSASGGHDLTHAHACQWYVNMTLCMMSHMYLVEVTSENLILVPNSFIKIFSKDVVL